jgi:predicted NAD/FAD-binding protein
MTVHIDSLPTRLDPGQPLRRVAVVGSGAAGLTAAWALNRVPGVHVTLLEREARCGGHAHTVDVTLPGPHGPVTHGVDTGFLVCNERTYPGLLSLFDRLGIDPAPSDMSFSVQAPQGLDGRSARLEWSGSNLDTVFAQRRNLASPAFWGMLRQILRFNRLSTRLAERGDDAALAEPLAEFLARHGFDAAFRHGYLLPMIACIWSCPTDQMLRFPVGTLIRFCHNHGLLQVANRPRWFTVPGGSRRYVQAIVKGLPEVHTRCPVQAVLRDGDGVELVSAAGVQRFDAVVLACHAPQALGLLGHGASAAEREVLSGLRTQPNEAVLHTDATLMPQQRKAWAAWNYERGDQGDRRVCLHYWINRLQPLPFTQPVLVSLNPIRPPRPDTVLGRFQYDHPVFDLAAIAAQRRLNGLQGLQRTWFAGAWTGYGFHEDALQAGWRAARDVLAQLPSLSVAGARRAAQAA